VVEDVIHGPLDPHTGFEFHDRTVVSLEAIVAP
jgi:hypothetical protein